MGNAHPWSRSTTVSLGALVAFTVTGAASAGPWAGVGFAAIFLLVTGLYHLIRGSSWLSPLVWGGRRTGFAVLAGGFVLLFIAAVASPDPTPDPAPATISAAASPLPSVGTSPPASTPPAAPPSASASPIAQLPTPTPTPTPTPSIPDGVEPRLAVTVLETLEVKGRAPKTGYDRALFGPRWADVDRNGCDTRNDILGRDLTETVTKAGTRDCVILTGTLRDSYTDTTISFLRGQDTSAEVQIDHVVALSDAWQKGAQQLDDVTRTRFANDPLNLLAVQGAANMQKGDGDAATWLPPHKAFRCEFVARQVAVKARYALWVTQAEHDAMVRVLSPCPGQKVPDAPASIADGGTPRSEGPTPTVTLSTAGPTQSEPEAEVYYANCTEARAAGAAPLLRGEPGYRSAMDGDDDGVACE